MDCHACSWRLLRAICRDGPLTPVSHFKPSSRVLRRRSYNVATHDGRPPVQDTFFDTPGSRKGQENNQSQRSGSLGLTLQNSNPSFDMERSSVHSHLKRELPWLKDPLKLLERVTALLDEGNQFKALELVRMASQEGQVAICWNRILQHLLLEGRATEALKVYNEMKKRAQFPDAFTYSIILRGLSDTKSFDAVSTAVSIFNSMSGPTSRVRPGIIHTNSALRVCARKGDLDAMWAIAGTIPDDGPQQADAITYTTILNALRFNAERQPRNLRPNQLVVETQDRVVMQARQIWEDVVSRWYQGKLIMDEPLVCAMGRILLMGSRSQDWDDVFSLVEQTTDIWRQAPHLRTGAKIDLEGKALPPSLSRLARAPSGDEGPDAGGEFDIVPQSLSLERAKLRGSKSATLQYIKPSTNTLSMLMDASLKLYLKNTADEYWKIFTDPQGLAMRPDDDNYHSYLRVLRQSRASAQAVKLVQEMKHCEPHPKTFRLALGACLRNSASPTVMRDASDVMDLMQARLPQMDVKACNTWMEIALKSPSSEDIHAAVERLGPQHIDLMAIAKTGDSGTRECVITLLKQMLRGYNRFKSGSFLRDDQKEEYAARTNKWHSLLAKLSRTEEWQSQGPVLEQKMLAKRKNLGGDRIADQKQQERSEARLRRSGVKPSSIRGGVYSRRARSSEQESRELPTRSKELLRKKIDEAKTWNTEVEEGTQAIRTLKQKIKGLKKSLPKRERRTAVQEQDVFPEFEHEVMFK
ncbi:hypothetical protein FKW77_007565 [Venturia effusa]|uniref:Pentacotripeptide-repeat region of PRORP domain-containing protein n=1 Tax=Venturia effusa TaxID=50376 RepID=A0A517LJ52_9PEZI|nr:hypothetical protein FKW77_007565 [Venturia effusa]